MLWYDFVWDFLLTFNYKKTPTILLSGYVCTYLGSLQIYSARNTWAAYKQKIWLPGCWKIIALFKCGMQ